MDDTADIAERLGVIAPPPSRDVDLGRVRRGAHRRGRRRQAVIGLAGVTVLAIAVLGAAALTRASDGTDGHVRTADRPVAVPAGWGAPTELATGDGRLFAIFDGARGRADATGTAAGIAELDPASGDLDPLTEIEPGSSVAHGAGDLWTVDIDTLTRIDDETGEVVAVIDLRDVRPAAAEGWAIAAGPSVVWLTTTDPGRVGIVRVDVDTAALTPVGPLGPTTAGPVLVGDTLWVGQQDGLLRVRADGSVDRFRGPETGRPTAALAAEEGRLWVASSPATGAPSVLGWIDPDTDDLAAALSSRTSVPGTAGGIGLAADDLCVVFETVVGQLLRCGTATAEGALVLDREPSEDIGSLDGPHLTSYDGALWATTWHDGDVLRIDPGTGRVETPVDLAFDGADLVLEQLEPTGPERRVASGPWPGGGRWRYVAFESRSGICTRLHSPDGGAGECIGAPPYETLSVGYADGRGTAIPSDAHAAVTPEVATVRFELASGEVIELAPVDVGLPVNFVYTLLPDDDPVARTEALGNSGQVLDTAGPFLGVPDG